MTTDSGSYSMLPGRHSVTRQPLGTKDTNRPRGQQNLSATEQSVVKTPCMSSIDSEPALFSTSDPDLNSSQQVEVSTPSLPLPSGKKLQIQQNLPVHSKKMEEKLLLLNALIRKVIISLREIVMK